MTIWFALVALGCAYALVAAVAFAFNIIYMFVLYLLRFQRSRPESTLRTDDVVERFIEYLETDWWYRTARSVYALPLRVLTSCIGLILSGVWKVLFIVQYFRKRPEVRARYLRQKRAQRACKKSNC